MYVLRNNKTDNGNPNEVKEFHTKAEIVTMYNRATLTATNSQPFGSFHVVDVDYTVGDKNQPKAFIETPGGKAVIALLCIGGILGLGAGLAYLVDHAWWSRRR